MSQNHQNTIEILEPLWSSTGLNRIGSLDANSLIVVALIGAILLASIVFGIAVMHGHSKTSAAKIAAIGLLGFVVPLVTTFTAVASLGYALWLAFHRPKQLP